MSLDRAPTTLFMLNSWPSRLWPIGSQGGTSPRCWNTNGSVVLCNDACVTVEAGSDGNSPSTGVYRFDCEQDSGNGHAGHQEP